MKLWMSLYATIWIVFLEFLLAMTPASGAVRAALLYVHIALGMGLVALAFRNFDALRGTRAPGRIKRVSKATFNMAIFMVATGLLLAARVGAGLVIPVLGISILGLIVFVHVVNAFAIITQAAAVAITHDMWEDREFGKESEAGEVPPHPMAGIGTPPHHA